MTVIGRSVFKSMYCYKSLIERPTVNYCFQRSWIIIFYLRSFIFQVEPIPSWMQAPTRWYRKKKSMTTKSLLIAFEHRDVEDRGFQCTRLCGRELCIFIANHCNVFPRKYRVSCKRRKIRLQRLFHLNLICSFNPVQAQWIIHSTVHDPILKMISIPDAPFKVLRVLETI